MSNKRESSLLLYFFLYAVYILYNYIYLNIILFVLLYANTYLNEFLIPDRFIWNTNGTKREQPVIWGVLENGLILFLEFFSLLLLLYFINKWFLGKNIRRQKAKIISLWTLVILFAIIVIFLTCLYFGYYFPFI